MEVWHIPHCFLRQLRLYGICNFACSGAGKIFGSSFADPVIDGHKDGDVSDSFGILFGLTGRLFAVLLQKVKQFMGNVLENPYKRIGFVSIPLAVFLFWRGTDGTADLEPI